MSAGTSIEWSQATWNPVTGCDKASAGCDNCYAQTFSERWRGTPGHHFENGFDLQIREDKLSLPMSWKKPQKIFVNSMSDLFHKDIPTDYIAQVFAVMALTRRHIYQLLTKRHARMRSLLNNPAFHRSVLAWTARLQDDTHPMPPWNPGERTLKNWPLPNLHLGVSVEDQHWANVRIPVLLDTPATVRWISAEPLLGPIRLSAAWVDIPAGTRPFDPVDLLGIGLPNRLDWVVVGGESGPGAGPMHPDWARSLRDQCAAGGVPYLFKQWGAWGLEAPVDTDGAILRGKRGMGMALANDGTLYEPGDLSYPDGPRWGEALRAGHDKAHLTAVYRVGKKKAGRELDGREHNEFPAVNR